MTTDYQTKIDVLTEEFSKDPDVIAIVKDIEARVATTKGHYGDYMTLLSPYKGAGRTIMARACMNVGADPEGVNWALRLLGGAQ